MDNSEPIGEGDLKTNDLAKFRIENQRQMGRGDLFLYMLLELR